MKILQWLAPAYTLVVIWGSMSSNVMPQVSVSHVDKLYHATAYLLMTLLWYGFFYVRFMAKQSHLKISLGVVLSNFSKPMAVGAVILSFLIGILIELGQGFVSTERQMDIYDVLANGVGIVIAAIILVVINHSFNRTKNS
ncbi:VanZ family protein [Nonlabens xiamenensis]|uniref:VanZ family protein n=1 Tax=Nonlabens xiamenensis TaxID=2341043 RepID=UPI001F0CD52B|nr:VanZ family protein [Nonlabens xiamenensis]